MKIIIIKGVCSAQLLSVANQSMPDFEIEHSIYDGGGLNNAIEIPKHFVPSIDNNSLSLYQANNKIRF